VYVADFLIQPKHNPPKVGDFCDFLLRQLVTFRVFLEPHTAHVDGEAVPIEVFS
jgi:hypothetical protein